MYGQRWDASQVTRNDEAIRAAKKLLKLFGRPGATAAEMKALGNRFRCGRCARGMPSSWEQLVSHYGSEQKKWIDAQEKIKEPSNSSLIFNRTHDLGPGNNKPLAQLMTPEVANEYSKEFWNHQRDVVCNWCDQLRVPGYYHAHIDAAGAESPILQHFRDVHNVAQAKPGVHFHSWDWDDY
ncbi:hypothetical protein FRC07_002250 [Ceratobasidium sp. 392]|nr:hypothetical protein FRC07_002250 [Ceratobasidium sp. 392]